MKRLYKGLNYRTAPTQKSYDVVVIGAGVGGLVCANLLARNGLSVLLVEQHYMVGGYCSSFSRKGYIFDAASHFYPLLGNKQSLTGKLIDDLGVTTEWIQLDPVDQFHFPDGTSFAVPTDFESYISKLKAEFPEEITAIDQFFAEAKEAYTYGLIYYFKGRKSPRLAKYEKWTVKERIDYWFTDQKLKLLLTGDCPHWGSLPSRTSFIFDSMLRLSYFQGNYYPRGGSQKFVDELAKRFEEHGGDILTSTLIRKVHVKNKRTTGVEIEYGTPKSRKVKTVLTNTVVANGDLRHSIEELVGLEHFDKSYSDHIFALEPTLPCYLVHLGLRGVPREQLEVVHGYYWNDWDTEKLAQNGLVFKLFSPTLYDPQVAPAGGETIIIQKVIESDFQNIEDWEQHKLKIDRYIYENLERIIPGVRDKIVVNLSASAATSKKYTMNFQGAMLGWEMSPQQLGQQRIDVRSPIKGLYFAGHWAQPGGGITPVIVSGQNVANLIISGRS